jgi:hypothetical protein
VVLGNALAAEQRETFGAFEEQADSEAASA